jgi:hypothetical protein
MRDRSSAPLPGEVLSHTRWFKLGPFEALDQRYRVWVTDPALAELLSDVYLPLQAATTADSHLYRVWSPSASRWGLVMRDEVVVGLCADTAAALAWLQWAVNRQVLEAAASSRLLLHAGAVERDGRVVVIPAAMEAGKTTLTVGLLDRGWAYLSDEAAALAPSMQVDGYAKPLSVDPGSWALLRHHAPTGRAVAAGYLSRQWLLAPHRLAPVRKSGRLAALVFTRYVSKSETVCTQLTPGEAFRHAAGCTFRPAQRQAASSCIRTLAAITRATPAFQLVSGDLAQACSAVSAVLESSTDLAR